MGAGTGSRVLRALRSAGAAVCTLLAGLAFAAWLGVGWLQDHVLSPAGFQDTANAISSDAAFRTEVVDTVVDRATAGVLDDPATGFDPLDRALQELRDRAVSATESFLAAPEQRGMWVEVLTRTHDVNVPGAPDMGPAPEHLVVDASAVGETVTERLHSATGLELPLDPGQLTLTVPVTTGPTIDALVWLAQWRPALPWLTGVFAVGAVWLAPRRWWAVAGVGAAGAVCAGALLAVTALAVDTVTTASGIDPLAQLVVGEVVSVLREPFVTRCVTGILGAAAVALAGVIGAVVRRRRLAYHGGYVHHR